MPNIYLKVSLEKNWRSQNFDFLTLKILEIYYQVAFWGAPNHADIIEFSSFLLQPEDQRSGSKIVCGFSIIWFWKEL